MTRRETIIRAILANVQAAAGVPVERSRTAPVTRDEAPLLNVEFSDDQPEVVNVAQTQWTLTVRTTLCIRGGNLDADADPILEAQHGAIMGDQSQGGLAIDTQPGPVRWKFADADAGACDIESEFVIQYRTPQRSAA